MNKSTIAQLEIAVKAALDAGLDRSEISRIVARAIANVNCGRADRIGRAIS